MQQPYERRLFSLRSLLAYHQLDGIIIASPANIYYYSGFSGEDSWLFIGRSAIGLLTDCLLYTSIGWNVKRKISCLLG